MKTYWFLSKWFSTCPQTVCCSQKSERESKQERCVVSESIHTNHYPLILIQRTTVASFTVYFHNFELPYRIIASYKHQYINLLLYSVRALVFQEWTFFLPQ